MNPNKVFTSAIVVVPPKEAWPQIQAIRQRYDKVFTRWPPHINLIYPFVDVGEFADAAAKMHAKFSGAGVQPFHITFENFSYFSHGKKSTTAWCFPKLAQGGELKHLQHTLEQVFPFCNEQSTKSHEGFTPHLSVGQFSGKAETEAKIKEFMATWKSIDFDVNEVYIISRRGEEPFRFKFRVPFQGAPEAVDEPYESIPGHAKHAAAAVAEPTQDLFVGNLPYEVSEEELAEAFSKRGVPVLGVNVPRGFGGKNKGFAFVKVDASLDIADTVRKLDKVMVAGRQVAVRPSNN